MIFFKILAVEIRKLKRSKITWISLAAYSFMVAVAGCFLWMMLNPDIAEKLGLLAQKAKFAFGGMMLNWGAFLSFIIQMGGIGGLILCSIIMVYVFGREYAEGTAKNMLALPIPRDVFVLAKILVSVVWYLLLTFWVIAETYIVGSILGLPGLTQSLFAAFAGKILVLALMAISCSVLAAWIAVETRGYFAPLGYTIFSLILALIFSHTGWGPWIPWSVLGIYSGAAGTEVMLGWGSAIVLAVTFVAGIALIIGHEALADNGQ